MLGFYRPGLAVALLTLALGACGGGGGGRVATSSYTVGGNLVGLVGGQQITLQNNGTNALTLSANGSFTFSGRVATGGSYSVTVVTPPVGDACAVSNGTGTNIAANVGNVTITCATQTFTVGGTLAGLVSGQRIILKNNGKDALTLKSNGPFTFSTKSAYASTYSVTVSSQPNQVSQQFCSVDSGSGAISAAVTNVHVGCNTESVLHDFTTADSGNGEYPSSGLIMDGAGNLYGTTTNGGSSSAGVVFKLSPSAGGGYTQTVLHDFLDQSHPVDGIYPAGGLIMDGGGNLYGTTTNGGSGNYGVAFMLSPVLGGGYTETVLHSFDGSSADGGEPLGGLIMDGAGNLYGTVSIGGPSGFGTVFKLSAGSYAESILYTFSGDTDGARPQGALIMDSAGNLYGTTSSSRDGAFFGAVFELTPDTSGGYTETTLHTFTGMDGATPMAGLAMDSAGNLYGTTRLGSADPVSGRGTVYRLSPSANGGYSESVIYSFTGGSDGAGPYSGLIMDSAGNLYGTASAGGNTICTNGCGTVFKLSPAPIGYVESVLFSFTGGNSGAGPAAGLIMDSVGNLYGTTSSGSNFGNSGGPDAGNVFEILVH